MVDAHQRASKTHFSRNDSAQLSFHNFVDAQHAMFHDKRWSAGAMECWISNERLHYSNTSSLHGLEFLRDSFKLIAFDHIADLIFAEVAQPNPAFET